MNWTFKDMFLTGACTIGQMDDYVEAWHRGAGQGQKLHDYLGLNEDEYREWLVGSDAVLEMRLLAQRVSRKFRIYQVDIDRPGAQRLAFRPPVMPDDGMPTVEGAYYSVLYEGELLCGEDWEPEKILERLFHIFNVEHPSDYKGRSMSVSDVVALQDEDGEKYYCCSTFSFMPVGFLNPPTA